MKSKTEEKEALIAELRKVEKDLSVLKLDGVDPLMAVYDVMVDRRMTLHRRRSEIWHELEALRSRKK